MDIFSHVLWVYVPTRNKLWRDEALLFAALPDFGFLLILLYVFFVSPLNFSRAIYTMPDTLLVIYFSLHSFVTLGIVALIVWKLRPRLLPALSGWFIHILIDIPVHDGSFGTRFLYPIFPDTYVSGISWLDYRVLAFSYLALVIAYIYSLRRERKKHVMGKKWKPDWIDKFHEKADALINRKRISTSDVKRNDFEGTLGDVSGEDRKSPGQGQNQPPEPNVSQDHG